MEPSNESLESLKEEVEQHNDQLRIQQATLSEQGALLKELREKTALISDAIIQLAARANVGFAQANTASKEARNKLLQIGMKLEE